MKISNFFFDTRIIFTLNTLNTLNFQVFFFFLLIIPKCIMTAASVNHIDMSDNIIARQQSFLCIEKIFSQKRKKNQLIPISKVDPYGHILRL